MLLPPLLRARSLLRPWRRRGVFTTTWTTSKLNRMCQAKVSTRQLQPRQEAVMQRNRQRLRWRSSRLLPLMLLPLLLLMPMLLRAKGH
jgi:hypothetical protein